MRFRQPRDLAPHEGRNLSQWVARMLFSLVGCLLKKPCPKGYSWRTLVRVRVVRYLGVIFTPR